MLNGVIQDFGLTVGNATWTLYTFNFNSESNTIVRLHVGDGGGIHNYDDFDVHQ